ncbi:MAG: Smr/MutS family protein [Saprospiraceae bacterium]
MEMESKGDMALLLPQSILSDLEFNNVLQRIADYAIGEDAKNLILKTTVHKNLETIQLKLEELDQFKFLIDQSSIQISAYSNINTIIRNLKIDGYVLSIDDILCIKDVLSNIEIIQEAIINMPSDSVKLLKSDLQKIEDLQFIHSRIKKVISKDRTIQEDASSELQSICRSIVNKKAEIYRSFKKIVAQLRASGMLAEGEESIRNGRFVLRLLSEHRRQVNGIIQDESEGGRTVFVEPQETVELNNDIFDLESSKRKEIQRILAELCRFMRPYHEQLSFAYERLTAWDVLLAKSNLAQSMLAIRPKLEEGQLMNLKEARHPLFYLKMKEQKKEIVPCTFFLNEKNRILLISGPNAGGKSILLKTVGLIQLMVQAGLFVPVDKTSIFRIFDKICTEIGDHQSIENELSTYSAKLSNMRDFEQIADSRTLVLIDEFGNGTEPQIGGAIAEALLSVLNSKKVFGVINTHYSNLKVYAHKRDGLVNGAMIFDEKNLLPTYRLAVGRPGSSYALEIAQKVKIPKNILDYAKKKVGDQAVSFENLLTSLDKEINQLKTEAEVFKNKQLELDRLIQSYNQINKQFEFKKLKLRLEQKQFDLQLKSNKQKELDKYVKEVRAQKNLEDLQKKLETQKIELDQSADEFVEMNHALHKLSEKTSPTPLQEGDAVKLIFSGMIGRVLKIEKGRIHVETENMTFNMKAEELLKLNSAVEIKSQRSIQSNIDRNGAGTFNTVLDIRGMRLQEAQEKFDAYIDKALLANVNQVYVLHGIGSGVLKRNLIKTLRGLRFVKDFRHPEEEGGQGTTLIEFQ